MHIYIKNTEKGRGIFTDSPIKAGEEIEICPVIVCPEQDRKLIDQTELYNYYFLWGDNHELTALALGYGSLYNHSYTPNVIYECYYEEQYIKFIALQDILPHSELTINYNYDADNQDKLWFEVR